MIILDHLSYSKIRNILSKVHQSIPIDLNLDILLLDIFVLF